MMKSALKTVLITGISSGVGASLAQQLWQDGITVCTLSEINQPAQQARQGTKVQLVTAHLSDPQSVHQSLDWIESNHGPIDVLINNVGFTQFDDWQADTDWTSAMQANLMRTLVLSQAVLVRMLQNHHGFMINLSSTTSNNPHIPPHAYRAVQTSVVRMTRGLESWISDPDVKVAVITLARIPSESSSEEMHILQADEVAQLIQGMLKLNNPALIRSKDLPMNNPEN